MIFVRIEVLLLLFLWYGVLYQDFDNVLVVIMFVFWRCFVFMVEQWLLLKYCCEKMKSFEVRKLYIWDKCWGNIRVQAFFEYEKCLALYFNRTN